MEMRVPTSMERRVLFWSILSTGRRVESTVVQQGVEVLVTVVYRYLSMVVWPW